MDTAKLRARLGKRALLSVEVFSEWDLNHAKCAKPVEAGPLPSLASELDEPVIHQMAVRCPDGIQLDSEQTEFLENVLARVREQVEHASFGCLGGDVIDPPQKLV
jgi:hypothetical protein